MARELREGRPKRPVEGSAVTVVPTQDSNSVQKVCALLRALAAHSPRRLSQLSAVTGLNKVTALRILDTLTQEGFVARDADGPVYRPGPEILALAASLGRSYDLRDLARPSLVRLADFSEDTALLSVRSGVESVCIDRQVGVFPIRANYLDIGSRRPLGVGAGSLALLMAVPDREVDAILEVLRPRLADYPRTSEAAIRNEIGNARKRGYVVILDRVIEKMGAVGVPVLDETGEVVAALSIAALSERIRDRADALGEALLREAELIHREMVSSPAVSVAAVARNSR